MCIVSRSFVCLIVLAVGLGLIPSLAYAKTVTFGQSILPVKMIYLDTQGDIRHSWDNVQVHDSAYELRVFRDRSRFISVAHASGSMYLDDIGKKLNRYESKANTDQDLSIEYFYSEGVLEEVRTYS